MIGETKTTALVATTLGMATVAAMVAVIGATASRADADTPKILDRIADARPAIGMPLERPASPVRVILADGSGTTIYSADPVARETIIAKGVPQIGDRIPVPMARSEAVLGLEVALAAPLPRPRDESVRIGMPLPRPAATIEVASVRQPLPKPTLTAHAVPWPTGPSDTGMIHLSAYTAETPAQ